MTRVLEPAQRARVRASLVRRALVGSRSLVGLRSRQASTQMTTSLAAAPLAKRSRSAGLLHWTWLGRNLVFALVVVLWLATAYWTFKDARRRIEDPWLVGIATLVGLFPPFLGPIIYMFFRPPEYLEDARSASSRSRRWRSGSRSSTSAAPCVARRSSRVPRLSRLHDALPACPACGQPLEPLWQVCPYCATRSCPPVARRAR